MREIKFRAFAGDRKGMYYNVGFINYDNCFYVIPFDSRGNEMDRMHSHSHKMIMMQYTGLKDKNGVDIYEGDICKVVNYASDYLRIEGKMYCVISWSNTAGFYGKGFGIPTTFAMGEEFEVIGNIYENPELLKEAK